LRPEKTTPYLHAIQGRRITIDQKKNNTPKTAAKHDCSFGTTQKKALETAWCHFELLQK